MESSGRLRYSFSFWFDRFCASPGEGRNQIEEVAGISVKLTAILGTFLSNMEVGRVEERKDGENWVDPR